MWIGRARRSGCSHVQLAENVGCILRLLVYVLSKYLLGHTKYYLVNHLLCVILCCAQLQYCKAAAAYDLGTSLSIKIWRERNEKPSWQNNLCYVLIISGQIITVKVIITASHMGYFEFRLCPKLEGEGADDILTQCYQDPSQYRLLQMTDGKTRAEGRLVSSMISWWRDERCLNC